MNHAVAVDASVAVKWVIPEPDRDLALKLRADAALARRPMLSAPHFPCEVANAIYQRLRSTDPSKHLDLADAEEALTLFLASPVQLVDPPNLTRDAFTFAHAHGLVGIYDALYVVLAQILNAELWTADGRLLTQLAGRAPWVRPLSSYPL
jgi:predicted nucleic acid-binding protein